MNRFKTIWVTILFLLMLQPAFSHGQPVSFNFYGDSIHFILKKTAFVDFDERSLSEEAVNDFYNSISKKDYSSLTGALENYKALKQADDWLYYQLVRKTAQQISPKEENHLRYTLYKWFFMIQSGYQPLLSIHKNQLLFYIQCDENIYNIPFRVKDGKQYVCLNYHDYGSNIDFNKIFFTELNIKIPVGSKTFSYKIHKLPDFEKSDYITKKIQFNFNDNEYAFKIQVNPQVNKIFANYPTVDYDDYLNMPLTKATYESLIPLLKKQIKSLNIKNGVDYLMRFTRYAFVFEPDTKQFGQEKRLTPEQTLLYEGSDCEDRVFLFYKLVKEIYNLPMVVLTYPQHLTIAVKFDKPIGTSIVYNGEKYSLCEPTPQNKDLNIGELLPELRNEKYEVVHVYNPTKR